MEYLCKPEKRARDSLPSREWFLELQLDADLLADLLRPMLQAVKTAGRDSLLVEHFFYVCGQAVEHCGVLVEGLLDGSQPGVHRVEFLVYGLKLFLDDFGNAFKGDVGHGW